MTTSPDKCDASVGLLKGSVFAVLFLILIGASGCQSAGPDVRRVSLSGVAGDSQGVVLETGIVVQQTATNFEESDLFLSVRQVVILRGTGAEALFCTKAEKASAVTDIPAAAADCEWGLGISLGANAPHAQSVAAGKGFLVRDRQLARIYRLLVVEDAVDTAGVATVSFDIAGVP